MYIYINKQYYIAFSAHYITLPLHVDGVCRQVSQPDQQKPADNCDEE